ncbi:hypothetical protein [Polaromonas sp.]|uniref:hypothetical protein n=1 Tax=Polaromonas sp. TaxID=1869339 RepID=UPI002D76D380|nr:hypothetical protein [Polaromonas sp.]
MKYVAGLAAAGLSLLLGACTSSPMAVQSPPQTVVSDGITYKVEQVTASTWSVALPSGLGDAPNKTPSLVKAVEKASGCKVTDSTYGRQGTVLNAQVDCGAKPKN